MPNQDFEAGFELNPEKTRTANKVIRTDYLSTLLGGEAFGKKSAVPENYDFFNFTPEDTTERGRVEEYQLKEIMELISKKPNGADEKKEQILTETEAVAAKIVKDAERRAEKIIINAEKTADTIKEGAEEIGYKKGYQDGLDKGERKAYHEHIAVMEQEHKNYLGEISAVMQTAVRDKDEIINVYLKDLRDLVLAIAEKVIHTSLKSSGEIIEKMIIAATEKLRGKQWVKLHIAKHDAQSLLEADIDITESISNVSDNVKVVVLEDNSEGSCIVELPDQIIDAGAGAQIRNIKELLLEDPE